MRECSLASSAGRAPSLLAGCPMRIAWFTPLPPVRSGISAYSAELLPRLADRHTIDVYVDEPPGQAHLAGSNAEAHLGTTTHGAHDFVWRNARTGYDLIVYQLGNATYHDYMWPYLHRFPGLVVVHDGVLHHSRARRLLQLGRRDEYRAEFAFDHPGTSPHVAEFVVNGFSGAPYYFWPMLGTTVTRSRVVAVHNSRLADDMAEHYPDTPIETIAMGVPDPWRAHESTPDRDAARAAVTDRHGIPQSAPLLIALGVVTPEKRIPRILRALEAISARAPNAHLLLVGQTVDHLDVLEEARARGVAERVRVTGFVEDAHVAEYLAAADVCLCLRWPTSRETSASWLRCLAAGKATIVTDLADSIDVPTLDPRHWGLLHASTDPPPADRSAPAKPVAVSIDILDEDHSLYLALARLIEDGTLREELGREARSFWSQHHTLGHMVADYDRVLAVAARTPKASRVDWPAHLSADGTDLARGVLGEFDQPADFL